MSVCEVPDSPVVLELFSAPFDLNESNIRGCKGFWRDIQNIVSEKQKEENRREEEKRECTLTVVFTCRESFSADYHLEPNILAAAMQSGSFATVSLTEADDTAVSSLLKCTNRESKTQTHTQTQRQTQ